MPEGHPKTPDQQARNRKAVNWLRFWIEVLIAIVAFNVIAAIITWLFVLPRLKH